MNWRTRAITGLMTAVLMVVAAVPAASARQSGPSWHDGRQSAQRRAGELLAALTPAQKEALVVGQGVPELAVPPISYSDGPNGIRDVGVTGVRQGGVTTEFPAAVNVAASWDRSLAARFGDALGAEASGQGANVLLAPTVNILRTPKWGRAAETFGEDPFLSGQIAASEVRAVQAHGVVAEVKHYLANNQETNRYGEPPGSALAVDAAVSDRALHEIYMPAFEAAIQKGGALGIMCSYNRVNGLYSCQNPSTLGALRRAGFRGFVGPDAFFAVRDPIAAFNAGVDVFTGGSVADLDAAVRAGRISPARLDQAARNVLTAMFAVGLVGHPPAGNVNNDVTTPAHKSLADVISTDGSVLLKNRDGVLPLAGARSIAVIGQDAVPPNAAATEEGGSPRVEPAPGSLFTPLAGITARAGSAAQVNFARGTLGDVPLPVVPTGVLVPPAGTGHGLLAQYFAGPQPTGAPVLTRTDPTVDFNGRPPGLQGVFSARWSGTLVPTETGLHDFSVAPTGGGARLLINGTQIAAGTSNGPIAELGGAPLSFGGKAFLTAGVPVKIAVEYSSAAGFSVGFHLGWQPPSASASRIAAAAAAARRSDVAVVFVNSFTSEGTDRSSLALPGDQDQLIEAVARANPRTVVVVHSGGPVLMPWLGQVAGVVQAWYGGEQGGRAIAALLSGDVNPSGHLPVTFPASEAQGPATDPAEFPGINNEVLYDEGVDVGYRYYDQHGQRPLFPFGFGLSYTSFEVDRLRVGGRGSERTVTVKVTNTGRRAGAEVVQVYVEHPRPSIDPTGLAGFAKVSLAPGQTKTVTIELEQASFATWDTATQSRVVRPGVYRILVGTSSRDLPLGAPVSLG